MTFDLNTPGHFTLLRFLRTLLLWGIIALFFMAEGMPHLRLSIPKQGYDREEAVYLGPQGLRKVYARSYGSKPPLIILLQMKDEPETDTQSQKLNTPDKI